MWSESVFFMIYKINQITLITVNQQKSAVSSVLNITFTSPTTTTTTTTKNMNNNNNYYLL